MSAVSSDRSGGWGLGASIRSGYRCEGCVLSVIGRNHAYE